MPDVPASFPERPFTMTASAMRLDVMSDLDAKAVRSYRQEWHARAWAMFDDVGEVKSGARFMENCGSRVEIILGVIPGVGEDAVPVHDAAERGLISGAIGSPEEAAQEDPVVSASSVALAEQLTADLVNGQSAPGQILGGWASKSFVVGEAYIIAFEEPDEDDPTGTTMRTCWMTVSSRELQVAENAKPGESRIRLKRSPSSVTTSSSGVEDQGKQLPPDTFFMRVWRPDSQWGDLSDSNLHAVLNECEELLILNASIRAAGLSRIPAGILYVSSDIYPKPQTPEEDDSQNPTVHPLIADMVKHMGTSVKQPDAASRMVPFLLQGPSEVNGVPAKDAVFLIDIGRDLDPQVIERCRYLIDRIAGGVELPAERLTGMGDANHWTAWQIDEETYRLYVAPTVQVPIDHLTTKYLRAGLMVEGVSREEAMHFTFMAEPSALVTRPNRAQNAQIAFDADAISWEALRTALGFGDEDEPTPEEILLRTILKQHVLPAEVIPYLAQILEIDLKPITVAEPKGPEVVATPPAGAESSGPPQPPGAQTAPNGGEPTSPPASATASATIGRIEAFSRRPVGTRLALLDRSLRSRLLVAADATVNRAVERAGVRVRTKLQGSAQATARGQARMMLASVPNRLVLSTLGLPGLARLAIDDADLFDGELDDLEQRYDSWTRSTQAAALLLTKKRFAISSERADVFEARQEDRRAAGWLVLSAGVMAAAREVAFNPTPAAAQGEVVTTTIQPGLVREALAVAGGATPTRTAGGGVRDGVDGGFAGGVATGDDVRALWGAYGEPWTRYEWMYNYDGPSPFEPHEALEGVVFSAWDDPQLSSFETAPWVGDFFFPGDHNGCMCDAAPVVE